jgi:hypothetical protein
MPTLTVAQQTAMDEQLRSLRQTLERARQEFAAAEAELASAERDFAETDEIVNGPLRRRDAAWNRLINARKQHSKFKDTLFQGAQMVARLEEEKKK